MNLKTTLATVALTAFLAVTPTPAHALSHRCHTTRHVTTQHAVSENGHVHRRVVRKVTRCGHRRHVVTTVGPWTPMGHDISRPGS